MREAGYQLGSSLAFLLVLNAGAIIGAIGASRLADRIGPKPVTTAAFLAATVSILLLSVNLPTALLFLFVAVAGLGSVGTQILVNGYVATHYPDASRATALGWSLGIGRMGAILGPVIGGLVVGSSLGFSGTSTCSPRSRCSGRCSSSPCPVGPPGGPRPPRRSSPWT
jgi:AAHS family benzoate transporter-like MFS transporter